MTHRGHVEQGKIVLDEPAELEEGASVVVEIVSKPSSEVSGSAEKRYERYRDVIGAISDMPADWSEKHDTYLRQQSRA